MRTATPVLQNKAIFLALLAALLLGLTACEPKPVSTDGDNAMMEGDQSDEFTGDITSLMKRGKDVTCTFTREDSGMTMDGTVYVSRDGRMNGQFVMSGTPLGEMTMYSIRDEEYGYTWGYPSMTKGTKVELDDEGKPVKKDKQNSVSMDDPMTYRCASWRLDESKFVPPSDVEFTDISETMRQIEDAMAPMKEAKCDACNQVPEGPGRQQCLTAMGCN